MKNIQFLNEEIRTKLIEDFSDHFVDNVSIEILKRMVWDQIYDDYQNHSDAELLMEVQINAPELLGLPELKDFVSM